MKKLLVFAFVVSSLVACSKNKPATAKAPVPDAKMQGSKPDTTSPKSEAKPAADTPTADPCASPN